MDVGDAVHAPNTGIFLRHIDSLIRPLQRVATGLLSDLVRRRIRAAADRYPLRKRRSVGVGDIGHDASACICYSSRIAGSQILAQIAQLLFGQLVEARHAIRNQRAIVNHGGKGLRRQRNRRTA